MYKKKISAILGPTNTGKTYTALKKLFNFNSGVSAFLKIVSERKLWVC